MNWDLEAIIRSRAGEMQARGFAAVPIDAHHRLILQYRIAAHGTRKDLIKRQRVEEVVHDELGPRGDYSLSGRRDAGEGFRGRADRRPPQANSAISNCGAWHQKGPD